MLPVMCSESLYKDLGGQSIPKFDYDLSEGVLKTFGKQLAVEIENFRTYNSLKDEIEKTFSLGVCKNLTDILHLEYEDKMEELKKLFHKAVELKEGNEHRYGILQGTLITKAYETTNKMTYQAMEGFIHNLNTMASRAGAQVEC